MFFEDKFPDKCEFNNSVNGKYISEKKIHDIC